MCSSDLYNSGFTDDASVVEAMGHPITLVEGDRHNIKITHPIDLSIAALYRQHQTASPHVTPPDTDPTAPSQWN